MTTSTQAVTQAIAADQGKAGKRGPIRSGFCMTGNHDRCKGAGRNGNGKVHVCPCDCHTNGPITCLDCGTKDVRGGFVVDSKTRTCMDPSACEATVTARLAADPLHQQIQQIREESKAKAAEARRAAGDPDAPARPARAPKAEKGPGKCVCCQAETKGGKFLPGHDARWIKQVLADVEKGRIDAATARDLVAKVSDRLLVKLEKGLGK